MQILVGDVDVSARVYSYAYGYVKTRINCRTIIAAAWKSGSRLALDSVSCYRRDLPSRNWNVRDRNVSILVVDHAHDRGFGIDDVVVSLSVNGNSFGFNKSS